jgi:hypothetical protein
MSLRLLLLVLAVCAVNAHGQTASTTPRQETVQEYQRRIETAGAISAAECCRPDSPCHRGRGESMPLVGYSPTLN